MNRHAIGAVVTLLALVPGAAQAQPQVSTSRLEAWIGCWSGAPDDAFLPAVASPLVCVTPTANANVVNVATVVAGKVESTRTLDVTGREIPLETKGCTGVQSANWSADHRRIFLKSTASCGELTRTTTGVLAMTPSGEWIEIQRVAAGEGENLRVIRYHDVGVPSSVPPEIVDALSGSGVAVQSARIDAGAAVGRAAILEATQTLPAPVVEAWVLERRQPFVLDANELISLADAGVSPRVTDAMIAVSHPEQFSVSHQELASAPRDSMRLAGRRTFVYLDRTDPWNWGYSPYGYYDGRSSLYGRYYPYSSFYNGYPYGSYGYYGAPVVVVSQPAAAPHGRRVKGQGYEPPPSYIPSPSQSSASNPPPSSGSTSSGSSSSGASSSSSSGRTAQPKP